MEPFCNLSLFIVKSEWRVQRAGQGGDFTLHTLRKTSQLRQQRRKGKKPEQNGQNSSSERVEPRDEEEADNESGRNGFEDMPDLSTDDNVSILELRKKLRQQRRKGKKPEQNGLSTDDDRTVVETDQGKLVVEENTDQDMRDTDSQGHQRNNEVERRDKESGTEKTLDVHENLGGGGSGPRDGFTEKTVHDLSTDDDRTVVETDQGEQVVEENTDQDMRDTDSQGQQRNNEVERRHKDSDIERTLDVHENLEGGGSGPRDGFTEETVHDLSTDDDMTAVETDQGKQVVEENTDQDMRDTDSQGQQRNNEVERRDKESGTEKTLDVHENLGGGGSGPRDGFAEETVHDMINADSGPGHTDTNKTADAHKNRQLRPCPEFDYA